MELQDSWENIIYSWSFIQTKMGFLQLTRMRELIPGTSSL
jgi:hypothetical protein